MQKRKVWNIYASLNQQERKRFLIWLGGEMDEHAMAYRLAELLSDSIEKSYALPAGEVCLELFAKKSLNDNKFRKTCACLTKNLKIFLAIEEVRADPYALELNSLKALNKRKLPDVFKEEYHRAISRMNKGTSLDADFYRCLYGIEREYLSFQKCHVHQMKNMRLQLVKLNQTFDAWWIHEKMGLACSNTTFNSVFGLEIPTPLFEAAMELIADHPDYARMDSLHLFYQLWLLLNEKRDWPPEKIKTRIIELKDILPFPTKTSLHALLLNHYIKELNKSGEKKDAEQVFDIYEWGIKEQLLFQGGYLLIESYKNLITICKKLSHLDKANHYLETYKPVLPPKDREDAYRLNKALILFASKDFQSVSRMFVEHHFSNVFYEIQGRVITLEAHYELEGSHQSCLIDQTDSLIRFLYTKQLGKEYRKLYISRLRLLKRLMEAITEEELLKLRRAVHTAKHLNNHTWLLEKIEERLKKGGTMK